MFGHVCVCMVYTITMATMMLVLCAGCSFADMWDEEDPGNRGNPLFCEVVRSHTPAPFLQSFANSIYRVLQVAPSNADTG